MTCLQAVKRELHWMKNNTTISERVLTLGPTFRSLNCHRCQCPQLFSLTFMFVTLYFIIFHHQNPSLIRRHPPPLHRLKILLFTTSYTYIWTNSNARFGMGYFFYPINNWCPGIKSRKFFTTPLYSSCWQHWHPETEKKSVFHDIQNLQFWGGNCLGVIFFA